MYKLSLVLSLMLVLIFSVVPAFAEEKATPEEVYENVVQAAEVMKSMGAEGLVAFNDPKGEFVWKDTYVLVTSCKEGKIAAHPSEKVRGLSTEDIKDKKTGRLFMKDFCESLNPNGRWTEYWWNKLGSDKIFRKLLFVIPVEGSPYEVAAGLYDENLSLEELNGKIGQ